MNLTIEARKLANYIRNLEDDFLIYYPNREFEYNHMGALLTDIILQSGLNYRTIVKPRIVNILTNYPDAKTLTAFKQLIEIEGLENIINWKHYIKLNRIVQLMEFLSENNINTCIDFKLFLLDGTNKDKLLSIKGIGLKTTDYLLKLLDVDIVAVDRHIYSFVENANLNIKGYDATKKTVEFAADFLDMSRASLDCSIWHYMSNKAFNNRNVQIKMQF